MRPRGITRRYNCPCNEKIEERKSQFNPICPNCGDPMLELMLNAECPRCGENKVEIYERRGSEILKCSSCRYKPSAREVRE